MLKTQIKASRITNLTDARYFAAWGVEWLSFQLDPNSEDYISPQTVMAIKEWVEGPKMIGIFGMIDIEDVKKGIKVLELDGVELAMFDQYDHLKAEMNTLVIKEIVIEKNSTFEQIKSWLKDKKQTVDIFQLNFEKNGLTWENFEKKSQITRKELHQLCQNYPIILSISVQSENLEALLDDIQPKGLNFKGGEEEKVGFKSFDEIDELFEVLETEE